MNRILAIVIACIFFVAAALLAGSISGTFAPEPAGSPTPALTPAAVPLARGTGVNTESPTVDMDAAVPFTATEDLQNITFIAPDILCIDEAWGGTYTVAFEVGLANPTGFELTEAFAVEVNGEIVPGTAAVINIPDEVPVTLRSSTQLTIPGGMAVRLVNVGLNQAFLTNASAGRSAVLRLTRTGD